MNHRDLLFEIGCEDLPPMQINDAVKGLAAAFHEAAQEARIGHGEIKVFATPRRLAILVEGVAETQEDLEQLRVGPPVAAAFDAEGEPTRALLGFAKGQGVSLDDLTQVTQTRRNKEALYIAAVVRERGQNTRKLLSALLTALPDKLHWPKPMRWGDGQYSFVRPIHWLVALYGREVIRLRYAGVVSGRATYGHRFHSSGALELSEPGEYEETLREHFVIASASKRRAAIQKLTHATAVAAGGYIVKDIGLLNEVTQLVEVLGEFDAAFLELPHKVLKSSMRKHQRYFALVDGDGKMMPNFITVSNTAVRNPAKVAHGNQRVLRARLQDAEFFFREDQKHPFESYTDALKRVTYLEELGSVYDKVTRIETLSGWLCGELGINAERTAAVQRCAHLCKGDLTTRMVGEFPDLQGFIGGEYAHRAGESAAIARGIADHYAPRGATDDVSASPTGAIVGIADRIDSIAGLFSIGRVPTGAADPFGLRRAALGLIRTTINRNYKIHLPALIGVAIDGVAPSLDAEKKRALTGQILSFIHTRIRHFLGTQFPTEVIESVLALGDALEDIPATIARIDALAARYNTPEFEPIGVTFKRAANIIDDSLGLDGVDASLLSDDAEKALAAAIAEAQTVLDEKVDGRDFAAAIDLMVTLRPYVDRFFDDVLVNAKDDAVRSNRHALLRGILSMLGRIADVRRL